MLLDELLAPIQADVIRKTGGERTDIQDIAYDSRQVRPGSLFVAVKGFQTDGHRYLPQALAAGASAVVVEDDCEANAAALIRVRNSRRALALCSAAFYGFPAHYLTMIGVTGTNGKTTTTVLIESILQHLGRNPGLIGTMYTRIGGETREAKNTTPESLDLQRTLAEMRQRGHDSVVMEVSSHGLALDRVAGCAYDVGVFTNLTQDHLDFHRDMDDYFNAKKMLFESLGRDNPKAGPRCAVVNGDDERCKALRQATTVRFLTYGIREDVDLRASDVRHGGDGTSYRLGELDVRLRLSGTFNVYNSLAALGAVMGMGFPLPAAVEALQTIEPVRGRFETVRCGQPYAVIVDYAHTPDGLQNVLTSAREITRGRLLVVFGCGGDRDRTKRPIMGGLAARLADEVFVTSDNPRTEEPGAILRDIESGLQGRAAHMIEDRRSAIGAALASAGEGDTVVIAGKGHETYQILKDRTIHFDDVEVVKEYLAGRR